MHNKQKERKKTLDKLRLVILENPNMNKEQLIAVICFQWGFSKRIVSEYYDILEKAGVLDRKEEIKEDKK